jgi:flagellar export protein FliJ
MNLTGLRHYRRQLEDMLRADLYVLERALEAAAAHSQGAQNSVNLAAERWQAALKQGVLRDEIVDRARDIENLTAAAGHAAAQAADARERWERKRADVIEAARERKTLELLEQRRLQQRMTRLRRLEQHALDEAAHIRFLRDERAGAVHET